MLNELIEKILVYIPEEKKVECKALTDKITEEAKKEFSVSVTEEDVKSYIGDVQNGSVVGEFFKNFAVDPKNETLIDPIFQSRVQRSKDKAIDNFMENEFPKRLKAKIKELYPDADPKDAEIEELQKSMKEIQQQTKRKDQLLVAKDLIKDLWDEFKPDFLLGETEEDTRLKCTEFMEKAVAWRDAAVTAKDDEWIGKTGGTPTSGEGEIPDKPFKEMNMDERNAVYKKDPEKYRKLKEAG